MPDSQNDMIRLITKAVNFAERAQKELQDAVFAAVNLLAPEETGDLPDFKQDPVPHDELDISRIGYQHERAGINNGAGRRSKSHRKRRAD